MENYKNFLEDLSALISCKSVEDTPLDNAPFGLGCKQALDTFIKIAEALQVSTDSILRPDVPEVNALYQKEFSELLADCTPSEMESILSIVNQVKATLHQPKNNDDY